MLGYIARRILATIPVVTVVAVLVFLLLRFTGGDPAAIIAGDSATTQQVAEIRVKLGLERPIVEQFVISGRARAISGESFFFKSRSRADPGPARARRLAACTSCCGTSPLPSASSRPPVAAVSTAR
jgi:ABC-type microcin C transport system permease subunit YejB